MVAKVLHWSCSMTTGWSVVGLNIVWIRNCANVNRASLKLSFHFQCTFLVKMKVQKCLRKTFVVWDGQSSPSLQNICTEITKKNVLNKCKYFVLLYYSSDCSVRTQTQMFKHTASFLLFGESEWWRTRVCIT